MCGGIYVVVAYTWWWHIRGGIYVWWNIRSGGIYVVVAYT